MESIFVILKEIENITKPKRKTVKEKEMKPKDLFFIDKKKKK